MYTYEKAYEFVTENTGEAVNDAMFERSLKTEEHFNIKFTYQYEPGGWDVRDTYNSFISNAVYDHILHKDEDLRNFIGYDYNNFDLHRFREWDAFEYTFDTSHCNHGFPEFYHSVIHISEKETGKEVWKIGVCLKEGEF